MEVLRSTGHGSSFWLLRKWPHCRGGCGIPVHTPNMKGYPQNLHTTVKDTIIFPFTKQVQIKALLHLKKQQLNISQ